TVILDKDLASLFLTAVDTEPTWGLGKEEASKNNDAGEEGLEDGREEPLTAVIVREHDGTTGDTGSENGTGEPEAVVETGNNTSVKRVGNLDGIGGTSRSGNGNTETEEETTSKELRKTK